MKGGKKKLAGGGNFDTTHQPSPDNAAADGGFDEIPVSDAAAAMEEHNQQQRKLEKGKEVMQESEEDFEERYDSYEDGGEEDGERSDQFNHLGIDHDGGEGDTAVEEKDGGADERPTLAEGFFEIEAVRKKRIRKGVAQYYIKWRDWPETDNTWEPLVNLQSCSDVIEAFELSLQSGKGKAGRKRKRKHGVTPQPPSKKKTQQQQPHLRKQRQGSPAVRVTLTEDELSSALIMDPSNAVETDVGVVNYGETAKEGDENGALAVSPNGSVAVSPRAKEGHEQNLNVSVHVQEHAAPPEGATCTNVVPIVDGNEANQNGRRIGARRRKSGAVKRFKPDSSSHGADNAEDAMIRTGFTNVNHQNDGSVSNKSDALNSEITEIIKAIDLTTSTAPDNTRKVAVTFRAKRADGTEVVVPNIYLKAHYPLLLIDFYERHLRSSPSPTE